MRLLAGRHEDCLWEHGIEQDAMVVIHGTRTLVDTGVSLLITGVAPRVDEGAWRGQCHPHSAKVLLKVGFKLFDEFPFIEGDPASVTFWARARNGLACTFGSKSPRTYLKMWLRLQQLLALGRSASQDELDATNPAAKLFFAEFLHVGTIAEVVSIFRLMEMCGRGGQADDVGEAEKSSHVSDVMMNSPRKSSQCRAFRWDADGSAVKIHLDGVMSVMRLRWRQRSGGFEMERAMITACKKDENKESPASWPVSVCNYVDHVIVLGEDLSFKQVPFPFQNRFDAVEIRLIEDGDHPARKERGLFATKCLEKDEYIGSYAGARLQSMFAPPSRYQFEANRDGAHDDPNDFLIDALRYGNETRYMNSVRAGLNMPDQNVMPFCYEVIHDGTTIVCVGFKAVRLIGPGEELLVNYGDSFCWEDDRCACPGCVDNYGMRGLLREKLAFDFSQFLHLLNLLNKLRILHSFDGIHNVILSIVLQTIVDEITPRFVRAARLLSLLYHERRLHPFGISSG